ncbi:leucyl/phenylalanyl-tRNA--protein transferase [Sediminitomix flava]|uniref:Leucyl/phenylalanyl-tRNA--protein transferase n=1 Tax=Sediminitomix flava TaxID=379075 RepID=A0A315Z6E4_SEDFL|nr:leucyl/phenylalanyl-tRNA--protein transferase [Sediminitomix flava]PWJ39957.1 leucyl/phenylalanyl-tRNA--protein transferase [Sediminitomix flava]
MPVFELEQDRLMFPPAYLADESGLLAVGGDLSPDRLIEAYAEGVFPWFNPGEEPLWWSPNPRFVLYPSKIKVSKSMRQVLRKKKFRVTFDQDFEGVISGCEEVYRPGQQGMTWISDELKASYTELFNKGFIHSVEVWEGDELVGGLYGGVMGKCFFGESMFAKTSNASKVGFIILSKNLEEHNFELIDCQVHSNHLESLGAEMVNRAQFLKVLERNRQKKFEKNSWDKHFRTDFDF